MRPERQQSDGNRQVLEEASAWFIEFRSGELDGMARRRFSRWLRRSPEHIRAYMEISAAYARLPTPHSLPDTLVSALVARAKSREVVVPLARGADACAGRNGDHAGDLTERRRTRTALYASVAAALCATAGLSAWLAFPHPMTYETRTAERRSITLEDGTRIELNARSEVRVRFTAKRRSVALTEGEALFKVAPDPGRPFTVRSSGMVVRDVGTQFDVDHLQTGTTVTVIEGRVMIQAQPRAAAAGAARARVPETGRRLELSAGEQATITPISINLNRQPNIEAATSWTRGELEFLETPLSDVVAEFNRYSRHRLVIESPSLATLRINGIYSSADTASLILFLQNQPDIAVTERDGEIYISRK